MITSTSAASCWVGGAEFARCLAFACPAKMPVCRPPRSLARLREAGLPQAHAAPHRRAAPASTGAAPAPRVCTGNPSTDEPLQSPLCAGNPSPDEEFDNEGRLTFWWSHGLISQDVKKAVERHCNFSEVGCSWRAPRQRLALCESSAPAFLAPHPLVPGRPSMRPATAGAARRFHLSPPRWASAPCRSSSRRESR